MYTSVKLNFFVDQNRLIKRAHGVASPAVSGHPQHYVALFFSELFAGQLHFHCDWAHSDRHQQIWRSHGDRRFAIHTRSNDDCALDFQPASNLILKLFLGFDFLFCRRRILGFKQYLPNSALRENMRIRRLETLAGLREFWFHFSPQTLTASKMITRIASNAHPKMSESVRIIP